MKKKEKKVIKPKRDKVLSILLRATQAWDVSPRGTVEAGTLNKLADEMLKL